MAILIYHLALLVIAVTSLLAIFSQLFQDNLMQRIGLAMVCFAAAMKLWTATTSNDTDPENTHYMLSYGMAMFAVGTGWKFGRAKYAKRNRRIGDHA